MGGTDSSDNIIKVNLAMHAFLHKMLWEEHGLIQDKLAWKGLSGQTPFREIDDELETIRRNNISKKLKGRVISDVHKKNMKTSAKKRCSTAEGRKHLLEHCKNRLNKKSSNQTKKKISDALMGRTFTEESKQKMRISAQKRCSSEEYKKKFAKRLGRI